MPQLHGNGHHHRHGTGGRVIERQRDAKRAVFINMGLGGDGVEHNCDQSRMLNFYQDAASLTLTAQYIPGPAAEYRLSG